MNLIIDEFTNIQLCKQFIFISMKHSVPINQEGYHFKLLDNIIRQKRTPKYQVFLINGKMLIGYLGLINFITVIDQPGYKLFEEK